MFNSIGIARVKNDLANSVSVVNFTKPVCDYEFRVLEKSKHDGSLLCVVYDGDKELGLADISPEDIEEFVPQQRSLGGDFLSVMGTSLALMLADAMEEQS